MFNYDLHNNKSNILQTLSTSDLLLKKINLNIKKIGY